MYGVEIHLSRHIHTHMQYTHVFYKLSSPCSCKNTQNSKNYRFRAPAAVKMPKIQKTRSSDPYTAAAAGPCHILTLCVLAVPSKPMADLIKEGYVATTWTETYDMRNFQKYIFNNRKLSRAMVVKYKNDIATAIARRSKRQFNKNALEAWFYYH